jgi:mannose-6-phosphate isomerase-like protein (cupin superfamily)
MAHTTDATWQRLWGRRVMLFRRTAAHAARQLIEYDLHFGLTEEQPPEHLHVDQEHQVELLSGTVEVSLAGRRQRLVVGDVLLIPAGQPHAVWNASDEPAHAVWHTFPAGQTGPTLSWQGGAVSS